MTTIAYKDGIFACDSQTTWYGEMPAMSAESKIFKTDNGEYIGVSGDCWPEIKLHLDKFDRTWLTENKPDITAIRIDRSHKIWVLMDETRFHWVQFTGEFFASGSGREYALGAMAAGASAEDAVKAAMQFDPYTGGKILTFNVDA